MASLKLEHIYKVYPNGTKAVSDFTMDIKDQEFIVFVGPSGCGKSTTLRMIAGLEDISAGELYIGDRVVNDVEPKDRDIAMVFQNYALYPHMTVYENMAFGLKLRHVSNEIIHERVLWAADVLGLVDYLDRKPKAMSGGQRQRVSLGRAILRNPKVMLLDEPLSNLDAKLRAQMRSEISKLHQQLKTTFVYVTHDQVEAMTLGTRVVVMKLGYIQQIDTPKNLYDYPNNKFVAGFIGTPQMNFFEGTLLRKGANVKLDLAYSDLSLNISLANLVKIQPQYLDGKHKLYIGIRCENISIEPSVVEKSKTTIDFKVSHFEELGNETLVYGDINMNGDGFTENATHIIIKARSNFGYKPGDVVKAHVDVTKINYFDKETEECVVPRIPTSSIFDAEIIDNKLIFDGIEIKLPKAIQSKNVKGLLTVPIDSIRIGTKSDSDFEGKITQIEEINGEKIIHLLINERVIFIKSDKKHAIGDKLNMIIDLAKVAMSADDKEIIKPLPLLDRIDSLFVNYQTAKAQIGNSYDSIIEARIKKVNNEFDLELEKVNKEYDKLIADAKKRDVNKVNADNKELIEKTTIRCKKELEDLKLDYKGKISKLTAEHKANIAAIKAEINEIYTKRVNEENSTYKSFMKTNKDRDAIRKRKTEHTEFKENNPREKENDLNRKLSAEAVEFETLKNTVKGIYKRTHETLTKEISNVKENAKREGNLVKVLNSELKNKTKKLEKARTAEVKKAEMLFFFKVNDFFVPTTELIANKMIQGLGIKVFSKDFLLEIPHDAYNIANEGIEGTLLEVLEYNRRSYYVFEVMSSGDKVKIYVELKDDKKMKTGAKVKLNFDLVVSHITEKALDIRIY